MRLVGVALQGRSRSLTSAARSVSPGLSLPPLFARVSSVSAKRPSALALLGSIASADRNDGKASPA